ncbi:macro domain-containing protein [Chitinispirillales bacterium ANBcel5]|uniref:macro domain-containing protein n=1 Tax=Cellulosispirillum alkaliphilum TaxID=3039283 RepID=UPI002A58B73E|nr:macro domain-containing protein [Chitinispirillales bacterium ANBcel5]
MVVRKDSKSIEVIRGNIVEQFDIDAVVNAANAQLRMGGGVAGAIHRAAGPELAAECEPLSPINPGDAVITAAYNLPNRYVIHCLGPVYGSDRPEDKLLANCYRNALKLADEKGIASVAFPSISTGVFGYPVEEASRVALTAILTTITGLKNVTLVRMVLFSPDDYELYTSTLNSLS